MERITEKVEGYVCINPEDNDCHTMSFCQFCDMPVNRCKYFEDAIEKLAKYEDLEEQGKLIEIKCRCKDCMDVDYSGCRGTTVYCTRYECYVQEDDFCKHADPYQEKENV